MYIVGGLNILVALLAILMMLSIVPLNPMIVGIMFLLLCLGGLAPLAVRANP